MMLCGYLVILAVYDAWIFCGRYWVLSSFFNHYILRFSRAPACDGAQGHYGFANALQEQDDALGNMVSPMRCQSRMV